MDLLLKIALSNVLINLETLDVIYCEINFIEYPSIIITSIYSKNVFLFPILNAVYRYITFAFNLGTINE